MQWEGDYYGPCTVSSNCNCPTTVLERTGHWVGPPRGLFLESGCVKIWHADMSLCHFVTHFVKLWRFDDSWVSACWYRIYDAIPSPSAIRRHVLRNCQNTLEAVLNSSASKRWRLTGRCCGSEWRRSSFDMCDTIQSWCLLLVGVPSQNCWN